MGDVENTTMGGAQQEFIIVFEGSQAVPTCPPRVKHLIRSNLSLILWQ
jgi:hypothetical protein